MVHNVGMIVVQLMGRLGNQLFQFAAGYALGRRLGVPCCFDSRYIKPSDLLLPHCIGEAWKEARTVDLLRVGAFGEHYAVRLIGALQRRVIPGLRRQLGLRPHRFVSWDPAAWDDGFNRLAAPCFLRHYFQNRRYVDAVLPQVCDLLRHAVGLESARGRSQPIVGLHFRRGDYVTIGWALPFDYYTEALEVVRARIGRFAVRVFSDDPIVTKLAVDYLTTRHFEIADEDPLRTRHPIADIDELMAMARCDHLIMANSTLSWWGATLGDALSSNADRIVISPKPWLQVPGLTAVQLADPRWIELG